VMTTCFRLDKTAYAAIWSSSKRFLQRSSRDEDDHTACYRMVLLLVFMEGLLCCGLEKDRTTLDLWNQAKRERDLPLLPALGKRFGAETWLNSRSNVRSQLLDLDKSIHDRNERKDRRPATVDDHQRIQRLQAHAGQNDDKFLLEGIQWRIDMLFASNPPTTSTRPESAFNLPINIYLKRRALVQGDLTSTRNQYVRSETSANQSCIPVWSGGPPSGLKAPMLQSRPPWQYSQSLGGNYVYKPSTDVIVRQDGQQSRRPSRMPISSLQDAVWEGPLPTPPSMAQPGTSGRQLSSGPQSDQVVRGQASSSSRIQPRRPQEPPRFVQGRTYPSKQLQVPDGKSAGTAPRSDEEEDEDDEDDEEDDTESAAPRDDSDNDEVEEEEDDDDDDDEEESGDDVKRKEDALIPFPGGYREPQRVLS
jgi:hypothetical protein